MLEGSEEKIICHTSAKKKKERKDSFTPIIDSNTSFLIKFYLFTQIRNSGQSSGGSRGKPNGRRGGNLKSQRNVRQVTEETMDPNHAKSDDFYEFSAGNSEGKNTMEMLIEDKPVNVIIDSGANCNFLIFFLYIILTYVLTLYLLLARCLHYINLHYLQYTYYNTNKLVKLNYS